MQRWLCLIVIALTAFALLDGDAAAGSDFSAFFHGPHSAFSFGANAEACTAASGRAGIVMKNWTD